jgi:alpha-beta hydrolase superfamily lysophospholipase
MPEATFLALEPAPVLAFLHKPDDGHSRGTAALICPPFGWDEICSYRGRRAWAQALARAGYPSARFDFPGTGDSAGNPRDPDRVAAWTAAVSGAAGWLRERSGCDRVAAIGIGLGGLIAFCATADGAAIDDLILWAVPAKGRLLVREMRAYASVVAARNPADAERSSLPPGALELIGYLLSAQTRSELEAIELDQLVLPRAATRRVLLLGRDGLNPDARLRDHLEQLGAHVTVTDSGDYAELMAHPQQAQTPHATIARTISWLGRDERAGPRGTPRRSAVERSAVELGHGDATIRETPLRLRLVDGKTFGILTEPVSVDAAPLTGVLLNGGALRHTGPNRSSVETARRWAARGVASVRFDLAGIGDAAGDERRLVPNAALYAPRSTQDVLGVLDQLSERGLPDRFVLGGLCSAGYWSLHAALADARVVGAAAINLYSFYWSESLVAERDTFAALDALRGRGFRRMVHGQVSADHLKTALGSIRPSRIRRGARHPVENAQRAEIERGLGRLRDRGTELLLLLSEGELLYDQLERQGYLARADRWPGLCVERIPSRDHMFRALWLQELVRDRVDGLLDRVLDRVGAAAS